MARWDTSSEFDDIEPSKKAPKLEKKPAAEKRSSGFSDLFDEDDEEYESDRSVPAK